MKSLNQPHSQPVSDTSVVVGILSDSHAHLDERIAEKLRGCDYILHAGDICDVTVLQQLATLTERLIAVTGNNDLPGRWPEANNVVERLPRETNITLPGGILAMEHGHVHGHHNPCHDALRAAHPKARVVIYGHTHKQVIDKSHAPWVVNPGASGRVRTNGGPSCLILTASQEDWLIEVVRYPDPEATH
ncbi:MAG: metallophosphoesterase family protein [Gammaproteobacteria bacterium]|nr:metallophosphoesterase family protein [Gammaproteobacteria bacterium]